jgi:hypothetical protein
MAEHKILGKKTIAEEMWFWSEESEEIFGGGLENAVTLSDDKGSAPSGKCFVS